MSAVELLTFLSNRDEFCPILFSKMRSIRNSNLDTSQTYKFWNYYFYEFINVFIFDILSILVKKTSIIEMVVLVEP